MCREIVGHLCVMRVAIPSTFPPYRGGIAAFNASMAAAFEAAGHEVVRVNWSRQYPKMLFPGTSQIAPDAADSFNTPDCPAVLDSIGPWTWRRAAASLQRRGEVDVVLVPFWHAFLAPASAGVVRQMRSSVSPKIIGLMHNAGSHDGPAVMEYLTRRFVRQLDEVWTLSADVAARVAAIGPSDLPVKTLFHPLYSHFPKAPGRTDALHSLGLPEDAEVYLFFGLIRPYKGLLRLLAAWHDFAEVRQHAHLLIAGECYSDVSEYQTAINHSPASNRIHLHNRFIPDAEVGLYFGAARAVVLPYERASQSGVTAMALHYGLPTLASDVGGLSEYIQPGQTGELFVAGDTADLAEAWRVMASRDYSIEAFEAARDRFSWSRFAASGLG